MADNLQDLRSSEQSCLRYKSSGTGCSVNQHVVPDISKDHNAFLFRLKKA